MKKITFLSAVLLFTFLGNLQSQNISFYTATFEKQQFERIEQVIKTEMGQAVEKKGKKKIWTTKEEEYRYKIILGAKKVSIRYRLKSSETPLELKLEQLKAKLDLLT